MGSVLFAFDQTLGVEDALRATKFAEGKARKDGLSKSAVSRPHTRRHQIPVAALAPPAVDQSQEAQRGGRRALHPLGSDGVLVLGGGIGGVVSTKVVYIGKLVQYDDRIPFHLSCHFILGIDC